MNVSGQNNFYKWQKDAAFFVAQYLDVETIKIVVGIHRERERERERERAHDFKNHFIN